jgi:hypothetical protein
VKEIAIVPRPLLEVGVELFTAIRCLRSAGIYPRSAIIEKACAVVCVDDREVSVAETLLRNNGFEAAAVTKTGEL